MRHLLRMTAGTVLAIGLAFGAAAQTKWDMPTPYPDRNFHTRTVAQFAADVERVTGGSLRIAIHSAGSLFKHAEIKRSVRQGLAPIGEVLISLHANDSPIYWLDSVPFLATGYDGARKLYRAQRPALAKRLAEEGLMLLYSVPWPPQGIYAKRELKSIDDLQGLKFRTYNAVTGRVAALAKAAPVQIEVPDLPTAFATGRVDVMITSASTGVDTKAENYLSHYHDTQAWLPRNVVFVNKAAFDKLTAAEKKAVTDAAKVAEERGWKASEEEMTIKTSALRAARIIVLPPSDALKADLARIGQTIAAEWAASAGPEGQAILEAYNKK